MFRLENGAHSARDLASEAIRLDVVSLIELYGNDAFRVACERAQRARARGDRAEKLIWTQVALKVRHRAFGDASKLLDQAEPAQRAKVRKPRLATRSKP
jgi:hypothetical protein